MIETGIEIENAKEKGKEKESGKEKSEQGKKGNLHHIDLHGTEYSPTKIE